MPWLLISGALAALYGAEKLGDWWNTSRGVATVPVQPRGGSVPFAPGAAVTLGAAAVTAAAVTWYLNRNRRK